MGDKSITTADRSGESTEFAPNENQLRALTAFQDDGYTCSVTEGMSNAGLHRSTWYVWTRRADFCCWWQEQVERWAAMNLPRVYAALLRRATETDAPGNTAAMRTFLERFDKGFVPRRRRDTRHGGALGVGTWDLSNASPEELARIKHALGGDAIVVRWADEQDAE